MRFTRNGLKYKRLLSSKEIRALPFTELERAADDMEAMAEFYETWALLFLGLGLLGIFTPTLIRLL